MKTSGPPARWQAEPGSERRVGGRESERERERKRQRAACKERNEMKGMGWRDVRNDGRWRGRRRGGVREGQRGWK